MSIVTVSEKSKPKKVYAPHQLRSRPFRCITLPIICIILFIAYWFLLVPITYHFITIKCKDSCKTTPQWRYVYWIVVSAIFLLLLALAVCLWCFKPKKTEKIKPKEHDKLLNQPAKSNSMKSESYACAYVDEKKSVSRETLEDDFIANLESKIEKTAVTLPIRRSIIVEVVKEPKATKEKEKIEVEKEVMKENAKVEEIGEKDEHIEYVTTEPLIPEEKIDEMFPRCSIRRKPDHRKRPDTLIIHSPKYPKVETDVKRHTMTDRPKSMSPLTPREIFFFDLIQGANRQTLDRTQNFIENECKHSSNNYTNLKKPEVKDFILKQKSDTEPSSPEYFIANVPQRNSCTTEVFMQVDGGQPEETLTICYIDQEDDVFTN